MYGDDSHSWQSADSDWLNHGSKISFKEDNLEFGEENRPTLQVDFNLRSWSFSSGWDPLTNEQLANQNNNGNIFTSFEADGMPDGKRESNEMVSEPNVQNNTNLSSNTGGQSSNRRNSNNTSLAFNTPNNNYNNSNFQLPSNANANSNVFNNFAANINPAHSNKSSNHFTPISSHTTNVGTFSTFTLPQTPNSPGMNSMIISSPAPNQNYYPNTSPAPNIHIPLNKMNSQKTSHSMHSPRSQSSPRSPIVSVQTQVQNQWGTKRKSIEVSTPLHLDAQTPSTPQTPENSFDAQFPSVAVPLSTAPSGLNRHQQLLLPPKNAEQKHATIQKIEELVNSQNEFLAQMQKFQREFFQQPTNPAVNHIMLKHKELTQALEAEYGALTKLYTEELLSLQNITLLKFLLDHLSLQRKHLSLLESELGVFLTQQQTTAFAELAIESQPFPCVLKDKVRLDEELPVTLKLLKFSSLDVVETSPVKITCYHVGQEKKGEKGPQEIKMETPFISFNIGTSTAKYNLSKFASGSKMQLCTLLFEITVKFSNNMVCPFSCSSRPFLVMSNESQFEDSTKSLFTQDVFQDMKQISWKYFANELQLYFLKSTRQQASSLPRGLSPSDLYYIQTKKFGCPDDGAVTLPQFATFWDEWFSKILRELRYKKRLLALWNLYLIVGFINKDQLKQIMDQQKEGVALLRFSERHEGALAVAHLMKVSTSTEMKTWNGLIKPEESKTRTHADILRDRSEITHILQFMNSYEMGKSGYQALPVFRPIEKHICIGELCTVPDIGKQDDGYDGWNDSSYEPVTPNESNKGNWDAFQFLMTQSTSTTPAPTPHFKEQFAPSQQQFNPNQNLQFNASPNNTNAMVMNNTNNNLFTPSGFVSK